MKYIAAALIRLYQRISRLTPGVCRFYPTCSGYAHTAILRFGLIRGGWLAFRRILRCHPWNPGYRSCAGIVGACAGADLFWKQILNQQEKGIKENGFFI